MYQDGLGPRASHRSGSLSRALGQRKLQYMPIVNPWPQPSFDVWFYFFFFLHISTGCFRVCGVHDCPHRLVVLAELPLDGLDHCRRFHAPNDALCLVLVRWVLCVCVCVCVHVCVCLHTHTHTHHGKATREAVLLCPLDKFFAGRAPRRDVTLLLPLSYSSHHFGPSVRRP